MEIIYSNFILNIIVFLFTKRLNDTIFLQITHQHLKYMYLCNNARNTSEIILINYFYLFLIKYVKF